MTTNKSSDNQKTNPPENCKKCGNTDFGIWTSSSKGTIRFYCRICRRQRAKTYSSRRLANGGKHTRKEWLEKLAFFDSCPRCKQLWSDIPKRPDKRYRYVWTKD